MATYRERLLKVQDAIDEVILHGSSMRMGDRQVTKADLPTLRLLEQDYLGRAAAEARAAAGGGRASVTYVTPK
jgi:hypothetical protein